MVAKAATKAGEFFCFHCGERVQESAGRCGKCGSVFDRITEAFRCPKCSNLLPVGAAICQSCNLRFKVRSVGSAKSMTEDDKFLIKLIDWGKKKEDGHPQEKARSVRQSSEPRKPSDSPSQKPITRTGPIPSALVEKFEPSQPDEGRDIGMREMVNNIKSGDSTTRETQKQRARSIQLLKSYVEEEIVKSGGEITEEIQRLFDQIEEQMGDLERMESQVRQLRSTMGQIDLAKLSNMVGQVSQKQSQGESHGLSKQALKKLLEDREKEVDDLRKKQDELEKREELLNRKIRAYAVKKKQLDATEREIEDKIRTIESTSIGDAERPGSGKGESVKEEWLRDQSKIRMGLLQMKNDLSADQSSINYYPSQISGEVMERIEVLEERLADITKERDDISEKLRGMESIWQDTVTLLKVLDQLLGKLPPSAIDEFSKSKDFRLYEKVLDKLNI